MVTSLPETYLDFATVSFLIFGPFNNEINHERGDSECPINVTKGALNVILSGNQE